MRGSAPDSLGLAGAVATLPEQIEAARKIGEDAEGLPAHETVANVTLLGLGEDAGAASLVAAVAVPYAPVPILVADSFQLPSFVGPDSLVVAFSWSGDGDEMIDAAQSAVSAGARLLVVSAPGPLTDLTVSAGGTCLAVAPGAPVARAAVGSLAVPVLVAFEAMGLFAGATDWVGLAIEQLRRRRDALAGGSSIATDLARGIGRSFPLFYGAGLLGGVAARHWKSQCNQNAKVPAWANMAPRLCHDELAGFGQHGDITRQVLTLVTLRHDHEHPQVADQLDGVAAVLDEVVAGVHEVRAEGDGELAQLLDLMLIGDVVSLAIAAHEDVDPGPTASLDRLRAAIDA